VKSWRKYFTGKGLGSQAKMYQQGEEFTSRKKYLIITKCQTLAMTLRKKTAGASQLQTPNVGPEPFLIPAPCTLFLHSDRLLHETKAKSRLLLLNDSAFIAILRILALPGG
jgi:hypothetical protein